LGVAELTQQCRRSFDITNVAVIGDHRVRLSFEDGTAGDVGF